MEKLKWRETRGVHRANENDEERLDKREKNGWEERKCTGRAKQSHEGRLDKRE